MYLAYIYLFEHLPILDISVCFVHLETLDKKAIRLVNRVAASAAPAPSGGENLGETGHTCPIASREKLRFS